MISALLKNVPEGPLALLMETTSVADLDAGRLHRLLLAYYRLLIANRLLPGRLMWPLHHLSALMWTPHPDRGVQFLAIRCYALHSGMPESEREKLETQLLGGLAETECAVDYGESADGTQQKIDGWLLPVEEVQRVADARNAVAYETHHFYDYPEREDPLPIHASELRCAGMLEISALLSVADYAQSFYCRCVRCVPFQIVGTLASCISDNPHPFGN